MTPLLPPSQTLNAHTTSSKPRKKAQKGSSQQKEKKKEKKVRLNKQAKFSKKVDSGKKSFENKKEREKQVNFFFVLQTLYTKIKLNFLTRFCIAIFYIQNSS